MLVNIGFDCAKLAQLGRNTSAARNFDQLELC